MDFSEQASWSLLRPSVPNSRLKDQYWLGVTLHAEEEAIKDSPEKFWQNCKVLLCHMSAIDIFQLCPVTIGGFCSKLT